MKAVRLVFLAIATWLLLAPILFSADVEPSSGLKFGAADTVLFAPGVEYHVGAGSSLRSIVGSDFDGDGDIDLLVGGNTSIRSEGILFLLKNNGDGTFIADTVPQSKPGIDYMYSADLDGDSDDDVALTGGGLTILKNNGDGTFLPAVDYPLPFKDITGADLDGDGDIDLAATDWDTTVYILKNIGDGTFSDTIAHYSAASGSIIAEDLDGDGDIDLATAGGGKISILKNSGNELFGDRTDYDIGKVSSSSLFAADLNGDGDLDLVVTHPYSLTYYDSTLSVLMNNGDGTFMPPVEYTTGREPWGVVADDFDGDGDKDLAATSYSDSTVSVFLNNGNGSFANRIDYRAPGPFALYAGDLDKDGDIDVASADFTYVFSPNFRRFTVSVFINLTNTGCLEKLGDLNHDCLLTLEDIAFEMNCVFLGRGDCRLILSDLNCDGVLSASDLVLELNVVFSGSPLPC